MNINFFPFLQSQLSGRGVSSQLGQHPKKTKMFFIRTSLVHIFFCLGKTRETWKRTITPQKSLSFPGSFFIIIMCSFSKNYYRVLNSQFWYTLFFFIRKLVRGLGLNFLKIYGHLGSKTFLRLSYYEVWPGGSKDYFKSVIRVVSDIIMYAL